MAELNNLQSVCLKGPSDWDRWISTIQKYARSQGIWEQIDPSNADKKSLLEFPVEPSVTTVDPQARAVTDLNSEKLKTYEFVYNRYRTNLQSYRDQQRALAVIQDFIIKSIGNYYSTISDEHDVAKELTLLKNRVQPSEWVLQKEIQERYQSVLNSSERNDVCAWITNWQKVLTEAKRISLPEADGLRLTQSFLESVYSINPSFSDYWKNKIEEARSNLSGWKERFPDGIEISEIFERIQSSKQLND